MQLTFYGAAGEVTGSCALIDTGKTRVLVDCGMFQGGRNSYERNLEEFAFDPASIDAVILTHAHIDHTGRLPKLVKAGFKGRVFATYPTRLFCKLLWEDAAKVMKDDARRYGRPVLYHLNDVAPAYDLLHGVDYHTKVKIADDFSFTFREAGHIFGSAFAEIDASGVRIVSSGDLGNDYVPILKPTEQIIEGDIIIMESTYGDRIHEDPALRVAKLQRAFKDTAKRGGTLLIPAFSLERAQEILYEINNLAHAGAIPTLPVFLDSPLAINVLGIYHEFPQYYDKEAAALREAGDDFFKFPGLRITKSQDESQEIVGVAPPKVIIAGSGMMHGGRIMHHLVDYLNDPKNTVLIVGYQSAGTVGRAVLEGAKKVRIDHHEIVVRAQVEAIGAYSAHADQAKLLRWAVSGLNPPKKVYLNHGEQHASETLADLLETQKGLAVEIAQPREVYEHT